MSDTTQAESGKSAQPTAPSPFQQRLGTYLRAGYPLLYVVTPEEDRAIEEVIAAVSEGDLAKRKVFVWSVSRGLCTPDLKSVDRKTADPKRVLPFLAEFAEPGVFILEDFHFSLDEIEKGLAGSRGGSGDSGVTDGFSGAELEQVVVSALYGAFAEGDQTKVTDRHLQAGIAATVPLSKSMGAKIGILRSRAAEWRSASMTQDAAATQASIAESVPVPKKARRVFDL